MRIDAEVIEGIGSDLETFKLHKHGRLTSKLKWLPVSLAAISNMYVFDK